MLKKITLTAISVCLAICCASAVSPVIMRSAGVASVKKEVIPVVREETQEDISASNAARFLNMLNHNFVYGEDFDDVNAIVNNSATALIDRIDDDGYINAVYYADYLKNMYNITVDDIDTVNSDFGYKEGFVFVIPRGYTKYEHELCSVTENEDGSFTVLTTVRIDCHDDEVETANAVTVFIKNEDSMFGYNIVSSDLIMNLCTA